MHAPSTTNQPEHLFRYRALGNSLAYALAEVSGDIWFSRPDYLNDPFDGAARARSRVGYTYSDRQISEEVKEVGLFNKRGWMVACWTETWDSPPMWAHYANNYAGVCFAYEKAALDQVVSGINENANTPGARSTVDAHQAKLQAVDYFPEMPTNPLEDEKGVFIKQDSWEYEREWRIAIENTSKLNLAGRTYCFFGALREIIVGYNADDAAVREISRLRDATCPNVAVKRVQLSAERNAHIKIDWYQSDMTPTWRAPRN